MNVAALLRVFWSGLTGGAFQTFAKQMVERFDIERRVDRRIG